MQGFNQKNIGARRQENQPRANFPASLDVEITIQQASQNQLQQGPELFSVLEGKFHLIKLKKLAATYIASRMSEKDVEELGKLFKQIDLNHDG